MVKIEVVNIVASTSVKRKLDLDLVSLALSHEDAKYNPESFAAVIYKLKDPKTSTLIFGSGKLICTGAKSIPDVNRAFEKIIQQLNDAGMEVTTKPVVIIQNMVATTDLDIELNLSTIAVAFGLENVEYEPEQFPGLVYRMENPKVVVLMFKSGKMVVTGAKSPQDAEIAVQRIIEKLKELNLI